MRVIDNIKDGLVVVIDWPLKNNIDYEGFDGKAVWPGAEWQSEESDTSRSINKITPKESNKTSFNPISIKNGLVSVNQFEDVFKYKSNLEDSTRLLYLKLVNFKFPDVEIIQKKFSFLGYDYGNYVSEDNYYSLIYHEVLGGPREEFKKYLKYLNKHLLFSSLDYVAALKKTKIEQKAKGEHLEDEVEGEEFQPIAVYSYNESN